MFSRSSTGNKQRKTFAIALSLSIIFVIVIMIIIVIFCLKLRLKRSELAPSCMSEGNGTVKLKETVTLKDMLKNKVEYKDMIRIKQTWSLNMKGD